MTAITVERTVMMVSGTESGSYGIPNHYLAQGVHFKHGRIEEKRGLTKQLRQKQLSPTDWSKRICVKQTNFQKRLL